MTTAQHDATQYQFTLTGAPDVASNYGRMRSHTMTVTVYGSGAAHVRILGVAILKNGDVGKSNRSVTFDLARADSWQYREPPAWVLDLLDHFPALALTAAVCREKIAS